MIRAMIVDDEQMILDNLIYIFEQLEDAMVLKAFQDPVEALREYPALKPDVVIMDINMPTMNGLEFAEKIRETDPDANLIFLTAYENFAVNAFGVNALDYLLKPVTTSKLMRALQRIRRRQEPWEADGGAHTADANIPDACSSSAADPGIPGVDGLPAGSGRPFRIPGMRNNRIYLIDPAEALYISVNQRVVSLHTAEHEYQLKQAISWWEEMLAPSGWFRCHRLFLINLSQISEVSLMFNNTYDIRMKHCSDVISVSRTYAAEFKKYLNI